MANIMHLEGRDPFSYDEDSTVYRILMEKGFWQGESPCGGKGTCGKCRIILEGDSLPPFSGKELTSLSVNERAGNVRLACLVKPRGEVYARAVGKEDGAVIQRDILSLEAADSPLSCLPVVLPPASLEDQRDTLSALRDAAAREGRDSLTVPFSLVSRLPCRSEEPLPLHLIIMEDRLVSFRPAGGGEEPGLFAAVADLGTTTVVVYLVDLNRGEVLDTEAAMNAQRARGGDVISRIEYAVQGPDNLRELGDAIGSQLARMTGELSSRQGVGPDMFLVTGNPTMIHLLAGLDPSGIATAPFVPVITETLYLRGSSLFLPGYEEVPVVLPASLSAYIGSDILAGVLCTGMDGAEDVSLLLDLGTNGELAMGNREGLTACSCAAGPAFEGANISFGMAGVAGAVGSVDWQGDTYGYGTIASEPARGICGTGIIDVMALLLEKGIVDETGRLMDDGELRDLSPELRSRILCDERGERAFLVASEEEGAERDILFTQRDVREVQMARAAIAGAVATLLREGGTGPDGIGKVYLAGGFGFWLREESAVRIGLIPPECSGRVEVVGNSSGKGGILMALDRGKLIRAGELRKHISYLELSSHPGYQNDYVMAMTFPGGKEL